MADDGKHLRVKNQKWKLRTKVGSDGTWGKRLWASFPTGHWRLKSRLSPHIWMSDMGGCRIEHMDVRYGRM